MSALINKFANLIGIESGEQEEELTEGSGVETVKEVNNSTIAAKAQREEKVMRFNDIKNKKPQPRTTPVPQGADMEFMVLKPTKFSDAIRIADEIKSNKIVALNLAGLKIDIARRILDFIEGTAHVTESTVTKFTDEVFAVIPKNVKLISELPVEIAEEEGKNSSAIRNSFRFDEEEEIRRND